MGLQLADLVERGGQGVPGLDLLVMVRLFPQQVRRHGAQPESRELHGFAGGVDLAEIGLRQFVRGAQAGQFAARAVALVSQFSRGGQAEKGQRGQNRNHGRDIDDFAPKALVANHAATLAA